MDIINYIILYLGAAICTAHIYDLTYKFQVKEYRFDRFFASIGEEGFRKVFYSFKIRFPSKSARNILIIVCSVLLLTLVVFWAYEGSFFHKLVFVITAPVMAGVLISLSVLLTEVPAQIKRRRIIRLAKKHLAQSKAQIIGITGSYGKTTTKEFLYEILSKKFKVAKTDANMNTDVGIALSILKNVGPDTDFFIAEMGAYTRGEIEKACRVAPPKYGILTAIGNQHLVLFGSHERLLDAKKELLKAVSPKGRIYLNRTIKDRSVLARGIVAPITQYSVLGKADVMVKKSGKNIYEVVYKKKRVVISVNLQTPYTLENLLPCIALALDLGMKEKDIQNSLKTLKTPLNKLSQQKGLKNSLLILDTANSSVDGFLSAIDLLSSAKGSKRIVVSKGIIELGNQKEPSYKKILSTLQKKGVSLYTTDRLFRSLDKGNAVQFFEDEAFISKHLSASLTKNTTVLLEGRFTPGFIQQLKA